MTGRSLNGPVQPPTVKGLVAWPMSPLSVRAAVAVGRRGGSLAAMHPTTLLGTVMLDALDQAGVNPGSVGQVIGGCIDQVGTQAANVTRMAWLAVGGPIHTPASTMHSACGNHPSRPSTSPRLSSLLKPKTSSWHAVSS